MKKYFLLFFMACLFLTGCSVRSEEKALPEAKAGVLDLTASSSSELIKLNGEWEIYWNQLLGPEHFARGKAQRTGYLAMPNNWDQFVIDGEPLPRTGYATFRLRIKPKHPEQTQGLILPVMYSNYKVWADDTLLAESGKPGTSRETSIPHKSTHAVYFQPKHDYIQITLQISNYHNYRGGMWEPIVFGSSEQIEASRERKMSYNAWMFGLMMMTGIYHLGLSLFHRKDKSALYFGLFCVVTLFRNLMVDEVFLTKIIPSFPWELGMKLEYIFLYFTVPFMAYFIKELFPNEMHPLFTKLCLAAAVLYSAFTAATAPSTFYQALMIYQYFIMLTSLYSIWVMCKAVYHRREGARYALIGFIIYEFVSLFELSGYMLGHPEFGLHLLGLNIFTISLSFVLSQKLATAFYTSERLTAQLEELNSELDRKVRMRTAELAASNEQLEKLNEQLSEWSMLDGLTNVHNRRYFDKELDSLFQRSAAGEGPLSILIIDIDEFKAYNDHYGHLEGDRCLRITAQELKQTLLPTGALFARFGGEEFAAALLGADAARAAAMAASLCDAIRQLYIPHSRSSRSIKYVTISVGVHTAVPQQGTTVQQFLSLADAQLYKAKMNGRDQYAAD